MASSVIVVDMGNTCVSLAMARGMRLSRKLQLATSGLSRKTIRGTLARVAQGRDISGAALCSVVPNLNCLWLRELRALIGRPPMVVHHMLRLGVGIALPQPERVGADRLANACAVSHLYGTPAIVVDFGTALTFDVVSRDCRYIGGVIAPGLSFMTDYFAERTALLPRLAWKQKGREIRPAPEIPAGLALGRNSVEAMLVGARTGYLGMVREILCRLRGRLGYKGIQLCATGGYAKWILDESDIKIRIDPDLTLRGISRIYELNL